MKHARSVVEWLHHVGYPFDLCCELASPEDEWWALAKLYHSDCDDNITLEDIEQGMRQEVEDSARRARTRVTSQ